MNSYLKRRMYSITTAQSSRRARLLAEKGMSSMTMGPILMGTRTIETTLIGTIINTSVTG